MDPVLLSAFTEASQNERTHIQLILNEANIPAKLGDLILEAPSFKDGKDKLKEKINADDLERELVIRNSCASSGMVRLVCKGNGEALGTPSSKKCVAEINHLPSSISTYLFKNVCVSDLLSVNQLEQAAVIAVDQTSIFFWMHLGRITGYNCHKAKSVSSDYLHQLKLYSNQGALIDSMVQQGN